MIKNDFTDEIREVLQISMIEDNLTERVEIHIVCENCG